MRRALLPLLLLCLGQPAFGEELFNKKVAVLEPFPREVKTNKAFHLRGKRMGAYKTPELILIAPNGRTYKNFEGVFGEYRFDFDVQFLFGPGPYRMELILRSNRGVKSAARFTVWYGRRKPKVDKREPLPDPVLDDPAFHPWLLEKQFLRRVHALRKEVGVKRLGWNEAAAARARDHASKMARADRRVHKFGGRGAKEWLAVDGAGKWAPGSGPDTGWPRVSSVRPFDRPVLMPAGPNVTNRVVQFVLAGEAQNVVFERYIAREAAFRLVATDPYCLEVGIGAARPEKGRAIYYCICFVQVNVRATHEAQEAAYRTMLDEAKRLDPKRLRRLALWSRTRGAESIFRSALRSKDVQVRAAGWDGLLLLDEVEARGRIEKEAAKAQRARDGKRWGTAYRLYAALAATAMDGRLATRCAKQRRAIEKAAEAELAAIDAAPAEKQASLRRDLRRRTAGMPIATRLTD
ncbi:MAG: hypothetical protein AAGD14_07800 [Planctomycetota bacterium]